MGSVFEVPPPVSLAVAGRAATFPVRRVYCVGRNYAEHAREMGGSGREAPFFFSKPADALVCVPDGQTGVVAYPPRTANLHHEIELVVGLGAGGRDLSPDEGTRLPWGYAIGIDLTRRDLQQIAKDRSRPWDTAKGFDQSAPIGPLHPVADTGPLDHGSIWLTVNGNPRQKGDLSEMIWNVGEMLSELSSYFELRPGDLVFTGTPAGVGALARGDEVHAGIDGLGELHLQIR
jgi:fumarylpyruvate hydrolase